MASQDTITLYISEKSAIQAAWLAIEERGNSIRDDHRIVPARMRDKDGSIDQGFKVSIMHDQKHVRWL